MRRTRSAIGRAVRAGLLTLGLAGAAGAQTLTDPTIQIDPSFSVTGLALPTTMAFVSSDEILVLEKATGQVRLIDDGVLQPGSVFDFDVNSFSERGLLGIAVNTEEPPSVFLYVTEADGSDGAAPLGNRVYRTTWNPAFKVLENPTLILDLPVTPGPNHDGGILVLGLPGEAPGVGDGALLYVVIGDLNRNGQLENNAGGAAPDDTSVILRVQQDGSPAPGNPFSPYCSATTTQTCTSDPECPGAETCVTEVASYFAYGVRNSYGMAFDPETGMLWNTENGPSSYDEINLVEAGFNSGWRQIMGPDSRDPQSPADLFDMPGAGSTYDDPEFSWLLPIGVTSIVFPAGSRLGSAYRDVALVGDSNTGQLLSFPLDAERTAFDFSGFPALADLVADSAFETSSLAIGSGFNVITDLEVGPDGSVYVVELAAGRVTRLIEVLPTSVPLGNPWASALLASAVVAAGAVALRRRHHA